MKRLLATGLAALIVFGAYNAVAGSAGLLAGRICTSKTIVSEIVSCWQALHPTMEIHEIEGTALENLMAQHRNPATVARTTHVIWLWQPGGSMVYLIHGDAEGVAVTHGTLRKSFLDRLLAWHPDPR